jgi:hypothetical protein
MGAVMNPKTKKRLNAFTAKVEPLGRKLHNFIMDEYSNLSDEEIDLLIKAEASILKAYSLIQQSK